MIKRVAEISIAVEPRGAEGHFHTTSLWASIDFLIQTELKEFWINELSTCLGKSKHNPSEWNKLNKQTLARRERQINTLWRRHSSGINRRTLPPSAQTGDYLELEMLWRSLWVCSERSEGTRISTGLIFKTRPSSSERDWPSGKQSISTSPVLGWTACRHTHTHA